MWLLLLRRNHLFQHSWQIRWINELIRSRRILNREKTYTFKYLSSFCFFPLFISARDTNITKARVIGRENPFCSFTGKHQLRQLVADDHHLVRVKLGETRGRIGPFFYYSGRESPRSTPPRWWLFTPRGRHCFRHEQNRFSQSKKLLWLFIERNIKHN
jgi:hypothetical protein